MERWIRVPIAPRTYRPYYTPDGEAPKLTIEVAEVPIDYVGEAQDDHMIAEVADQDEILHAIKEPWATWLILIDLMKRIRKAREDD